VVAAKTADMGAAVESIRTYFFDTTDLFAAEQAILTRSSLSRALLASFSIPGALPPVVIDGHLMVDGGTVNNFPVDVMLAQGFGRIIGS